MSGILGVVRAGAARASEADLGPIRDALAFWGGGGEAAWSGGPAALAHLLQDATRSRHGPKPASLPERDGAVVAADVRLDNRSELADRLGRDPDAVSDEELVLHAYLRWGGACAERLAGAFAFAVWDARRNRLVCARDHAGFRPFNYWEGAAGFVFATDARAVVACDHVPEREDEQAAVARFTRNAALLRERSLFAGVAKLPAGELLVVEPDRPSRRARHWRPEESAPRAFRTPEHCVAALRDAIEAATADAVDCAVPVGAHLSGGLDSSAVTALAQRALEGDGRALVRAFSWSPPADGPQLEHARIEAVAERVGVPVTYTQLTGDDLRAERRRHEALVPGDLLLYENRVLGEADRLGVGVLLSGWGGDEVASFNGRGQLTWLVTHGRWLRLWRESSAPARRDGRGRALRRALRNVVGSGLLPLLPGPVYHRLGLHEYPNDRALRLAGHGWETLHPGAPAQREVMQRRTRVRRSPRATQLAGIGLGHVENRIESWARAGAAHGIDHRYPLLDRRVLELSLALPPDVWIRDGWDRWPFRRAIAPLLPESVVWAAETEETSRLDLWFELLADAPLDELAGESPLLRAHRRRQQELARILRERRRPPSRP